MDVHSKITAQNFKFALTKFNFIVIVIARIITLRTNHPVRYNTVDRNGYYSKRYQVHEDFRNEVSGYTVVAAGMFTSTIKDNK